MNSKFLKTLIVVCFITVPLLSSIISTVHLIDMYYLGNPTWISITIAIAIEIGAVSSFLTLSILSKMNKTIVWTMFILLFLMQVIGNVYFSYDWITAKIIINPMWISTFKEMLEFFSYEMNIKTSKMILAMLIGIPIPLMSLFLLKSMTDYIGTDTEEGISMALEAPVHKEPEDEKVTEDNPSTTYFKELEEKKNSKPIIKTSIIEKKSSSPEIHISKDGTERGKRLHPSQY